MWETVKGFLGTIFGWLGGFFSEMPPPGEWPGWVYGGLAVAIIMGIFAYIWNRTGKGMLIILTALVFLIVMVALRMQGG